LKKDLELLNKKVSDTKIALRKNVLNPFKSERLFYIYRISNFFANIQMITKVLLIDDDPDEHEIFSHALKKYNSKITCVTLNGLESRFLLIFFPM